MSLLERYTERINKQMEIVETTQKETIIAVGNAMAECVKNGGHVYVYDTGHIINSELVERGGGLMLLKSLRFDLNVQVPHARKRTREGVDTSMLGMARYALKAANIMPGDMLFIGTVSGKSFGPVDLAIEAKKYGLTVVALTSLEYSRNVQSLHPSGKRLFECADFVLDNCAPAGEGMVDVPGLEAPFGAASGLSAALIMWSVCAQAIDKMMEYGITPSVFKSENFKDGPAFNAALRERYAELGY